MKSAELFVRAAMKANEEVSQKSNNLSRAATAEDGHENGSVCISGGTVIGIDILGRIEKLGCHFTGNEKCSGFSMAYTNEGQAVSSSIHSSHCVHVTAKVGIPCGQPEVPLIFEGNLGWKGSAQTSTFRPPAHHKSCSMSPLPRESLAFTGIDLNIPAEEDQSTEHERISSTKQARSLCIDLNSVCDENDQFMQHSSLDDTKNPHSANHNWTVCHLLGSKIPDPSHFTNTGDQNFILTGHEYFAGFRNTYTPTECRQKPLTEGGIQLPKELREPSSLTSHHFNYPFQLASRDHPWPCYDYGDFKVIHLPLQSTYGNSQLHAKRESNMPTIRMDEGAPFLFHAKNYTTKEQLDQESSFSASVKRKEPEGGLETFQFGYRHVT